MVGERFLHTSAQCIPSGFGAGATSWVCPHSHSCGDCGSPHRVARGDPPAPSLPCSPLAPRFLRAGSCCHLLATLCPAERRWGQRARDSRCGARDAGTVAQLRPCHGDRTKDQPGPAPAPHPPHPCPQGHPPGTTRLYPPVMVATSRRPAVADPWGAGLPWGRAAVGDSGPGWRWQAGWHWPGGGSCGTAVSSLAGVTWGVLLPWGEAPSSPAPWSGAGGRQSLFSGPCLGRRSC